MGLFDIFKSKSNKKEEVQGGASIEENRQDEIQVSFIEGENKVQIEFYDLNASFGQFYDTTRLIIDRQSYRLGNSNVNNCLISWYGQDDAIMVENDPREDYEQILATLDVNKMISDREYCTYAMKQLLNKKRVLDYLERGKSLEEPEHPCGNYVGGIIKDAEGRLRKRFDCKAGEESHYSPYMIQTREIIKKQKEEEKAKRKADLEEQIEKAQSELNNYD